MACAISAAYLCPTAILVKLMQKLLLEAILCLSTGRKMKPAGKSISQKIWSDDPLENAAEASAVKKYEISHSIR